MEMSMRFRAGIINKDAARRPLDHELGSRDLSAQFESPNEI